MNELNKKLIIIWCCIFLVIAGLIVKRNYGWTQKRDFKIGIISGDGIGIVNMSPQRRMVNYLSFDPRISFWIS